MKFLLLTFFIFIGVFTTAAQAESITIHDPSGLWLTQNERSAIRVEKCGEQLCGRIAWIIDGGMQYDSKNPKMDLRKQPMCGLQIMQGLQQSKTNLNKWEDGYIYKADEGDIYSASATIKSQDEMTVRGYLAISLLGKSQTWKRVSAKNYPKCKVSK